MVRAGRFIPTESEVSFGQLGKGLGEFKIDLSNGRKLFLNGKIDRLDIAEIENEKTAIIFDYKRKNKTFSWSNIYHGLELQLPIYMLAVRNLSSTKEKIVGAFYMSIEISP